jgi:hypothetical protein
MLAVEFLLRILDQRVPVSKIARDFEEMVVREKFDDHLTLSFAHPRLLFD